MCTLQIAPPLEAAAVRSMGVLIMYSGSFDEGEDVKSRME